MRTYNSYLGFSESILSSIDPLVKDGEFQTGSRTICTFKTFTITGGVRGRHRERKRERERERERKREREREKERQAETDKKREKTSVRQ